MIYRIYYYKNLIQMQRILNFDEIEGWWRSIGYSYYLHIMSDKYQFYETSIVGHIPNVHSFFYHDNPIFKIYISNKGNLLFKLEDTTFQLELERIKDEEFDIAKIIMIPNTDPELNFKVFWHIFNENYAFFKERHINWDNIYNEFKERISKKISSDELFENLCLMVKESHDYHINIFQDYTKFYSPGIPPIWVGYERERKALKLAYGQKINGITNSEYKEILFPEILACIRSKYLNQNYRTLWNGFLFYGFLHGKIGYINLMSLVNISENPYEDIRIAGNTIDQILLEFKDITALIIDLRFNWGGIDQIGLNIAKRFAPKRTLVFTKTVFEKGKEYRTEDVYIHPAGKKQFLRPVYILISNYTNSAAEVFLMAMITFPHIITIGEPTYGCHSDTLERLLPNGWHVTLSNEIYYVHGSDVLETKGISPNYPILMNLDEFKGNQDKILENAIELALQS